MYSVLVLSVFIACAAAIHPSCVGLENVRTISGRCNNLDHPDWGSPGQNLINIGLPRFKDNISLPVDGPNERSISQRICATPVQGPDLSLDFTDRLFGTRPEPRGLNMMAVVLGQFLTHDADLTPIPFDPSQPQLNFGIPMENCFANTSTLFDELCIWPKPGDPFALAFPQNTIFTRPSTGTFSGGQFVPINAVTSFLDLSTLYGSNDNTSSNLRTHAGGRMIVGADGLLPLASDTNTENECGSFRPGTSGTGDIRSDENFLISTLHILFLKEHNRLAAKFESEGLSNDEQIFQKARKWNVAQFQNIIAYELVPALVGEIQFRRHFGEYEGYDRHQNPGIWNFFSTAAFRLHTLLNLPNLVIEANCSMILGELKNLTNFPTKVEERQTCEPIRFRQVGPVPVIRGALIQRAQAFDTQVINALRHLRLTAPGNGDVPAANIFRGRANGLPDFNTGKQQFGEPDLYDAPGCNPGFPMDPINCFRRITSNNTLASELRSIYKKVDKIDAWIGILAEKKPFGSSIGYTSTAVFLAQVNNLRNGDRFWFERTDSGRLFSNHEITQIRAVKLSTLLNTHFPELDAQENALFVNEDFYCTS